jgi:putative NADH-flavin reductase
MLTPPIAFEAAARAPVHIRPAATARSGERLSYADFAVALLDEIDAPAHHRMRIAVAPESARRSHKRVLTRHRGRP